MIGVAIQNIEYVESGGPILMDVLWAVVDLAIFLLSKGPGATAFTVMSWPESLRAR